MATPEPQWTTYCPKTGNNHEAFYGRYQFCGDCKAVNPSAPTEPFVRESTAIPTASQQRVTRAPALQVYTALPSVAKNEAAALTRPPSARPHASSKGLTFRQQSIPLPAAKQTAPLLATELRVYVVVYTIYVAISTKSRNELWKWEEPEVYSEWTDGFVDNEYQETSKRLLDWLLLRSPDEDLHQPQLINDYYKHYLATGFSEENGAPVKIAQSAAKDVKVLLIPFYQKPRQYKVSIIIEKRKPLKGARGASVGTSAQRSSSSSSKRGASPSWSILGEQAVQSTEDLDVEVKQEQPSWVEGCYNPAEPPVTLDMTEKEDTQPQQQTKRRKQEIPPSDRVTRLGQTK